MMRLTGRRFGRAICTLAVAAALSHSDEPNAHDATDSSVFSVPSNGTSSCSRLRMSYCAGFG
ncbi:MAG: hypothetical protein ACOC0O_03905, partial [Spirochaetota bacterium]